MKDHKQSTKSALSAHNLAPKKRFGQNFLVHQQTAEAIVLAGEIEPTDTVVEVGVGLGALTQPLAAKAKQVLGFEIDSGIIRYHQESQDLPDNVTLIHQDILRADFNDLAQQCGGRIIIMANLPYSISNPFIFKLIDNATLLDQATIMLQKEVADRLTAAPKTKDYGVPTVLLGSCGKVRKILKLGPEEFHPRPKVDSVVIRIDFAGFSPAGGAYPPYNVELFKRIVRTTFNQRRKTILNTLGNIMPAPGNQAASQKLSKQELEDAICKANLVPNARPETLTTRNFIDLARQMAALLGE